MIMRQTTRFIIADISRLAWKMGRKNEGRNKKKVLAKGPGRETWQRAGGGGRRRHDRKKPARGAALRFSPNYMLPGLLRLAVPSSDKLTVLVYKVRTDYRSRPHPPC